MLRRGRVRSSRLSSGVQLVSSLFMLVICVTFLIPRAVPVGVVFALIAIAATVVSAYNLLSDRGISLYDVDVDVKGEEGPPARVAFDSKLRRLAQLREDGLITDEEFERKRAEILGERW